MILLFETAPKCRTEVLSTVPQHEEAVMGLPGKNTPRVSFTQGVLPLSLIHISEPTRH